MPAGQVMHWVASASGRDGLADLAAVELAVADDTLTGVIPSCLPLASLRRRLRQGGWGRHMMLEEQKHSWRARVGQSCRDISLVLPESVATAVPWDIETMVAVQSEHVAVAVGGMFEAHVVAVVKLEGRHIVLHNLLPQIAMVQTR